MMMSSRSLSLLALSWVANSACSSPPPTSGSARAPEAVTPSAGEEAEPAELEPAELEPTRAHALGSAVIVPAGSFEMGSTLLMTEEPVHTVHLSAFEIDRYEVTVGEYERCVREGPCPAPDPAAARSDNREHCNYGVPGREEHPVNCLAWEAAKAYCAWAGKRLPTEAEWERAARGSDGRLFPWGHEEPTCDRVSFLGCGQSGTMEVGTNPSDVSGFGVFDLAGNAREWIGHGFYRYTTEEQRDPPRGAVSDACILVRGGAWGTTRDISRASFRICNAPGYVADHIGFRCARSLPDGGQ